MIQYKMKYKLQIILYTQTSATPPPETSMYAAERRSDRHTKSTSLPWYKWILLIELYEPFLDITVSIDKTLCSIADFLTTAKKFLGDQCWGIEKIHESC
jgi:hypothetical protein